MMVWSNVNALYTIPWVHSTTFYPELRNEFKNLSNPRGSIPQLLLLTSEINLKFFSNPREVKPTCNTHLTPMKYRTEIIVWSNVNVLYTIPWVHFTTFDPELRNERFTLISFMGFPAILSALQPFQICICNRINRKFTFSNGPQLMGTRFMANFHASVDNTCKTRI